MITPSRPTVVLLAASNPVDRAVFESDLLRAGFRVHVADTVDGALEIAASGGVQVLVMDLGLQGGGGFSLCRKLADDEKSTIPAVALSKRAVDPEVRQIGADCGVETFLEPPHSVGQLRAAVEQALARARRRLGWDGKYSQSGDLASWSVADLIRYMEYYGWGGTVSTRSSAGSGVLHFKDGSLTNASLGSESGERALAPMLTWEAGHFTLRHEPNEDGKRSTRPGRNIHRSTADVLEEYLDRAVDTQRRLAMLPGAEVPHRLEVGRAHWLEPEVRDRLARALDGNLTLGEALRSAKIADRATLAKVERLLKEGAIRPVTGVILDTRTTSSPPPQTADAPPQDLDARFDPQDRIERTGKTVRRKLQLTRRTHADEPEQFSDVEPESVARKQRRQKQMLGWLALFALVVTITVAVLAFRSGNKGDVDTRVIDDEPSQTSEDITASEQ